VGDAYVQPSELIFGGGDLRGLRADKAMLTHELKCGCRAAHASMTHEIPRSSCCPGAAPENFAALADLSGQWIDLVHGRRPPRGIVLEMDSSASPTHGEREMSVWNGHYACTC
jgi:DDE family transposase